MDAILVWDVAHYRIGGENSIPDKSLTLRLGGTELVISASGLVIDSLGEQLRHGTAYVSLTIKEGNKP